ncbi:hypothetical protein [Sphingomonas sp. S2-65]|uniref:hypothetical protein n=1 Tax=Sphingomonas sp. S2-65 TaxID=2903960 RepID=UPI001F33C3E9|nr:hypothetical protein [Sphingomonas sp. S2-65]UYY57896.1 hypothetical protein LZ586_14705 [Sphingomonas sp. S2-65]
MSDGKVPMPASGQNSPKLRGDGVSDVDTHGLDGKSQSDGAAYENPHTGKEARGESEGFEGGQSTRGYFGKGQDDGNKVDPEEPGAVGQGGQKSGGV